FEPANVVLNVALELRNGANFSQIDHPGTSIMHKADNSTLACLTAHITGPRPDGPLFMGANGKPCRRKPPTNQDDLVIAFLTCRFYRYPAEAESQLGERHRRHRQAAAMERGPAPARAQTRP